MLYSFMISKLSLHHEKNFCTPSMFLGVKT